MRWRRCGEGAVLVECGSLEQVNAARAAVVGLKGVTELVPGARSLLIEASAEVLAEARRLLESADLEHPPDLHPREITLDVRYDGEDLELVAKDAGLSVDEVVKLHTEPEYTVAFTGFAPGFGYLSGLPERLQQSRLDTPRTRVPAGSVGVAGEFTGVYPRSSPGGWRLLGHTEAVLFDAGTDPPALLAPGDRVRFRMLR